MKTLIIFCTITLIVVGIFGLSYPFAKNLKLAPGGAGITARGSDLVALKSGKVNTPQIESVRQKQAEIYREWPMYANDQYGFSVRYPQALSVSAREISQLDYPSVSSIVVFNNSDDSLPAAGTSITISRLPLAESDNWEEIINQWRDREIVLSEQELSVAGLKARQLWISTPQAGTNGICEDIVFVKKGDQVFIFQSVGVDNQSLFFQMLETVKFYY